MANYSYKADGEANHYTVFKDENWLLSILHNGQDGVGTQQANLNIISNSFRLIEVVKEMRDLQKEFFSKERKPSTIDRAKAKEREVDQLIKSITQPATQTDLFK